MLFLGLFRNTESNGVSIFFQEDRETPYRTKEDVVRNWDEFGEPESSALEEVYEFPDPRHSAQLDFSDFEQVVAADWYEEVVREPLQDIFGFAFEAGVRFVRKGTLVPREFSDPHETVPYMQKKCPTYHFEELFQYSDNVGLMNAFGALVGAMVQAGMEFEKKHPHLVRLTTWWDLFRIPWDHRIWRFRRWVKRFF